MKHWLTVNLKRAGLKAFKGYGRIDRFIHPKKQMTVMSEIKKYDLLIGGNIQPSTGVKYFGAVNPSTGEAFAQVADAQLSDMQGAISAARTAFDQGGWSDLTVAERGIFLKKIAEGIRQYARELAEIETWDVGKTLKQTTFIDVPTSADTFEYFSNIQESFFRRQNTVNDPVNSETVFEPMGVIGCIIPWNYPLIMAAWKLAPALIAGNTVVLKPSPLASVSLLRLGQIIRESGIPAGVVNIVASQSDDVAAELVRSPLVDMVSFSGGTETGKKIMEMAAGTVKKVVLELGGKSPSIVFADCDMEAALGGVATAIFMNQGQMCAAGSRLLLDEKIYDVFLKRLVEKVKALKVGEAMSYDTDFGPVISFGQQQKILSSITRAIEQGAKIECGGKALEISGRKGFYLQPTILSNVTNNMEIAQEEVFGPVLSVIRFSSEDEALRIANDSRYGLAACVWSKDKGKTTRLAHKLQVGTVWVNTYGGFYDAVPFGGYKQSGFGRELGPEGVLEFMRSKHICTDQTPGGKPLVSNWF